MRLNSHLTFAAFYCYVSEKKMPRLFFYVASIRPLNPVAIYLCSARVRRTIRDGTITNTEVQKTIGLAEKKPEQQGRRGK